MDLLIITLLVFFIILVFIKKISSGHPKEAIRQPPGPWNLPVIGSLHQLLRPQPAHQILSRLSAIHGPIMGLKLGEIRAVVVSSSSAAKEIMKTHDISFASRPIYSSIKVITYGGKGIAFAPYGEFWRQMRRLCLLELLSAKRVQSFRIQVENDLQFPLTNDHIKAIIGDLLVAGSSPTSTTLVWAMSELIRNPDVKCKAQSEVRETFGRGMPNTMAEEELMSGDKLSYLKLVIKETLRLHPPAPLLLPRENPERCEVMGYEIPAKTMVMVNAWAMGRDSDNWDEPDAFRPERFDGSDDAEFKGKQTKFIPFGAGRRICPGMSFALAVVEMTLAHLLYYFDWEYFGGELDMTETPGISADRKFPLCLLPIQHIPLPIS
ncbi:Cytochrome P450 71D10 [Platanthera guangdongensis]|uniref:Cytochrome P450 71D10 n=1 Tax=Platanthera guangdongensis TaxID=2320717 RepID=A0ABR2LWV6_9ASPA